MADEEMKKRMDVAQAALAELLSGEMRMSRVTTGARDSVEIERGSSEGGWRYVRLTWVGAPAEGIPADEYSLLGGVYGRENERENFDGRSYGGLSSLVEFARKWLVELRPPEEWNKLAIEASRGEGGEASGEARA